MLRAGFSKQAKRPSEDALGTFRQFIEDNRDELTALQISYSNPYRRRALTEESIAKLAEGVRKPPYGVTTEEVWRAYEQVEQAKVRGHGPEKTLTGLVALIRFAVGQTDVSEPFADTVNARFERWLADQQQTGRQFTPEQVDWGVSRDYGGPPASHVRSP